MDLPANYVLMSWEHYGRLQPPFTTDLKLGLQHVIRITTIQWLQSSITRLLASPSIRSVMFVLPRNTNLMAWFMKCKCSVENRRRVKFTSTLVWFPMVTVVGNAVAGLSVQICVFLFLSLIFNSGFTAKEKTSLTPKQRGEGMI